MGIEIKARSPLHITSPIVLTIGGPFLAPGQDIFLPTATKHSSSSFQFSTRNNYCNQRALAAVRRVGCFRARYDSLWKPLLQSKVQVLPTHGRVIASIPFRYFHKWGFQPGFPLQYAPQHYCKPFCGLPKSYQSTLRTFICTVVRGAKEFQGSSSRFASANSRCNWPTFRVLRLGHMARKQFQEKERERERVIPLVHTIEFCQ